MIRPIHHRPVVAYTDYDRGVCNGELVQDICDKLGIALVKRSSRLIGEQYGRPSAHRLSQCDPLFFAT